MIGQRFRVASVGRLELRIIRGLAEGTLLSEGHHADGEARHALGANGPAVDTAELKASLRVGRNGAHVSRPVGRPDAVDDTKQHPIPLLIFGGYRNLSTVRGA